MKKIFCISAALALLAATVSCEKGVVETDFTPNETPMVPVTLTGTIPETRVSLDGVTPKWTAGDPIAVFTTDGTLCPAFSADQGGSTTTFSGTKPDGSTLGFALYPYSSSASCSGGSYTFTLPAEQDGTLGSAVMAAQVPAGEGEMVFSNLCTVVKVHIPAGMKITKIEILRSDRVSGSFSVNGSTLAVTPAAAPSGADRHVVASKSAGWTNEDVYLSVLPSSSKQLELLLTNAAGKMALVSKTLKTDFSAGHLKNATVPSGLNFSDVAKIGASTASQNYASTTQPDKPQIKNAGFEDWLDNDNLPKYWNSFQTFENGGKLLTKTLLANGYSSSNRQVKKSTDKRPGTSGSYSCRIWARSIAGLATAQGNLTTGRVYASNTSAAGTGNYNYTDQDGYATVNGFQNPFHMDFTGRPDSLSVWIKFVPKGSDSNHPYVKIEAILHDKVDYKSGYNSSDCTGGTHHIGEASNPTISGTGSNWSHFVLPFEYDYSTTPSFVLINIATNSYPGGGTANDEMYIDDIEMIYNLCNLRTDANGWATLYLNYAALVPSGATAYYVKEVAGGYASLVAIPAGQVIPKNTAVLVKGSAHTTYAFNGRASDIKGKTVATVAGNLLQGTLTQISKPSGTCRVLSSESTSSMAAFGTFTGSTIAANTAWLTQ
ncbi:MAG: hypothetical protein IJ654_04135 [Bacteroidales bacterium]|nr:hypothetical protein [Bacteroidales bacterium]